MLTKIQLILKNIEHEVMTSQSLLTCLSPEETIYYVFAATHTHTRIYICHYLMSVRSYVYIVRSLAFWTFTISVYHPLFVFMM